MATKFQSTITKKINKEEEKERMRAIKAFEKFKKELMKTLKYWASASYYEFNIEWSPETSFNEETQTSEETGKATIDLTSGNTYFKTWNCLQVYDLIKYRPMFEKILEQLGFEKVDGTAHQFRIAF